MPRLLAVNGSYHAGGAIDQAVSFALQTASAAGSETEVVYLRDYPIEFCRNCRECTQTPGESPGRCVHQDGMHELIAGIEAADGLILASPTNFSSATALYKRFMERLIVYAYWPWGSHAPQFRRRHARKKALLIASSAAPGILGRFAFTTLRQLKMSAATVGAKPVGSVSIGFMAQDAHPVLPDPVQARVRRLVARLL
jgi:multimeric flavodoxin WrbA